MKESLHPPVKMFPLVLFMPLFDVPGLTLQYVFSATTVSQRILNSSGCVYQSESVTCECISEGFPSPSISWPLLEKNINYTLINYASNHSVKSIMSVSLKDLNKKTVECVSIISDNEIKKNLSISESQKSTLPLCYYEQTLFFMTQKNVSVFDGSLNTSHSFFISTLKKVLGDWITFLVVFGAGVLVGMLLLSIIACVIRCHRNRIESRCLDEDMDLVTIELFSKQNTAHLQEEDGVQDFQDDRIQNEEAAAAGGPDSDGQLAAETNEPPTETVFSEVNDTDMAPTEAVYSDIDFSVMKERNPSDVEKIQDATETEYAEIKKGETKERQDINGEDSEMLEGSDGMEVLMEEDAGKDVPLYSSVDEMKED